jgi:hypothetical protein
VLGTESVDLVTLSASESVNIKVADAGKTPFSFASGPAGNFNTGELAACSKLQDLLERKISQDSGEESEFHKVLVFRLCLKGKKTSRARKACERAVG